MVWAYAQALIALLVVLFIMIGVVFLLRRVFYGRRFGSPSVVTIEVLGAHMLQPKVMIYVLRVANKTIVVGLTEHGLQLLTEVDVSSETTIQGQGGEVEQKSGAPNFLEHLKKNLGIPHSS
ncbi:MAG: flagellar biosynthetic protein FliO [Bacteroidetes bacterium]|nr:flagellar biosynthetic protein FliO [Bacteroidota bacterium]